MHPCLGVDEILRLLAAELVESEANSAAIALACCCKTFEEPVLDALWETQDQMIPLLKCFPQDVWKEEAGRFVSSLHNSVYLVFNPPVRKSFKRVPTKAEWIHSRKYARRMRELKVDPSSNPVTLDVFLALQLRAVDDPWLPRLEEFECHGATETFIPFIPLFLSPKIINIKVGFTEDSPTVVVASMISRFSILCPNLEFITLTDLPRDSVITDAVSEMLLGCNRDTLQIFQVESPLTEEAREVVYRLPRLDSLWAVIQGSTSLPTVALPNLTAIDIEYDRHLDWLQGFRGGVLEILEDARFHSESEQLDDFLAAFESVALTTSIQNTLSELRFYTSRSWNPNYSSLLSFRQLKELEIEFSCDGGCSSRVDDNIIMSLAGAMPKLEVLQLGTAPCQTPTGVTVNGLIGLAYRCLHLSRLRIHFRAASLVDAGTSTATPSPSGDDPVVPWGDCALSNLEVGETPIPAGSAMTVTLTLLQIFPRILKVEYINREWRLVAETIKRFRRIGTFVHRSSKAHSSDFTTLSNTIPGGAIDVGRPLENDQG